MSARGPARAQEHAERLQALSRPGGPLAADRPHATVRNERWFRQTATGPQPRAARQHLHDRVFAQWRAHAPEVATDRHALLLAGPPGAGKSRAQSNLTQRIGVPLARWRIINSDDFKGPDPPGRTAGRHL
jgi:hypothetical protein